MIVAAHMRNSSAFLICVCALALCAVPRGAAAQASSGPSTEFYGGYSYLRDPGNSILAVTSGDDSFTIGWAAGIAHPVWRAVAAVGEVSGHYKTKTTLDEDVSLSFHAFMGGPRVSTRAGQFVEFVQILAGVARGHGSAFGVTESVTDLALQPGGGVDYPIGRRLAARVELDYRWIKGAEHRSPASQFRAVAALVVRP